MRASEPYTLCKLPQRHTRVSKRNYCTFYKARCIRTNQLDLSTNNPFTLASYASANHRPRERGSPPSRPFTLHYLNLGSPGIIPFVPFDVPIPCPKISVSYPALVSHNSTLPRRQGNGYLPAITCNFIPPFTKYPWSLLIVSSPNALSMNLNSPAASLAWNSAMPS